MIADKKIMVFDGNATMRMINPMARTKTPSPIDILNSRSSISSSLFLSHYIKFIAKSK